MLDSYAYKAVQRSYYAYSSIYSVQPIKLMNVYGLQIKRLAALGGPSPRKSAMNMMHYVIADKVGMEYNWVGHGTKEPFAKKNTVECITGNEIPFFSCFVLYKNHIHIKFQRKEKK